MARPLWIYFEHVYYHVMNRGRGRQRIFQHPADYQAFLDTLAEAHERFGLQIHAYCLMGQPLPLTGPYASRQSGAVYAAGPRPLYSTV